MSTTIVKNKQGRKLPPEKILKHISDGIIVLDKDWKFTYVNTSAARMFGRSKHALLGNNIWNIFPEYKQTEAWEKCEQARQTGKPVHFSTQTEGAEKWFGVDIYPDSGSLVINFEDITLTKKAEEALKHNEKKSRAILEKSWGVTTLVDRNGKRIYTTPSIKKVLGYSAKDNIGHSAFIAVHPEDLSRIRAIFQESLKHPKQIFTGEYRVKDKRGKYQWLESTLTNMLEDPDIRALVVNYHNITDRKQVEDRLKESEERFRTLIQQSTDVIQLISADGKVLYTSDSIEQVLGYTPDEIKGVTGIPYLHPDDAPRFYKNFSSLLTHPEKIVTLEYRLKHKNGSWIWVEATGANYLDNPAIRAIVGNFRDITRRKQLEQQKDEFMGMISHELKTPVTSLKAFAQVLQKQFETVGEKHAASLLGKMDGQINKLTVLIADLLDVTKLETGKLHFHEEFYSFDAMVGEIIEEIQRTTTQHVIVTKGKTNKNIFGDKERIGQVLTNMLSNAIKYSPKSQEIIVHLSGTKTEVTCCVQDFGIGIAKEKQTLVFERFFRESGFMEDTFPGLGLGLYVSSEIVKRQGGSIWVNSKKGKGSTFCFRLPILKQEE